MFENVPTMAGPAIVILHGLGHGGALAALAWIAARPGTTTGAWTAARSWVLPDLAAGTAATLAGTFWVISLVAFVLAGAGIAGVAGAADVWRAAAIVGTVASLAGIVLFFGTWPMFNTLAAIVVNIGILAFVLGGAR